MKNERCSFRTARQDKLVAGEWPPELVEHARTCADCAEELRLVRAMRELRDLTRGQVPRLDYGPIWLRAHFKRQQEAQVRALRPLAIFQLIAGIGIGMGLLFFAVVNGPFLQRFFLDLLSGTLNSPPDIKSGDLAIIFALVLGMIVMLTTLSLSIRSFASQD